MLERLLVGLVSYGSEAVAKACLESLRLIPSDVTVEVAVVDNAGTWEQDGAPVHHLVVPGRNLGYAGAVNLLREMAATGAYDALWLLNPDCALVSRRAVQRFLAEAETALLEVDEGNVDEVAGGLAGSVMLAGDQETVWFAGGGFDPRNGSVWHEGYGEPAEEWSSGTWHRTRWVTGGNVLFLGSGLTDPTPWDESYFLYLEELEWQLRTQQRAVVLQLPVVRHFAGSTMAQVGPSLSHFFLARNSLLLKRKQGRLRHALRWEKVWVTQFLLRPLAHGNFGAMRAAWLGRRSQHLSGSSALARYTAMRQPA